MPYREAHSRIVPRVFNEDGDVDRRPAKCCLCGKRITKATLCYGRLPSDPPELSRPLHVKCRREFELFARALWAIADDVTPTF